MQHAPARPDTTNPLATAASAMPANALSAIDPAARLIGGMFMLLFAWDQYGTFDRYFAGTWGFAVIVAVVALVTAVPIPGVRGAWVASFGAAMLFFGGAMFASAWFGLAALACGLIAWLATAALIHQRGHGPLPIVGGLILGTAATFATVLFAILVVEG